jgi:hypothetical protein
MGDIAGAAAVAVMEEAVLAEAVVTQEGVVAVMEEAVLVEAVVTQAAVVVPGEAALLAEAVVTQEAAVVPEAVLPAGILLEAPRAVARE